jgi:hypothetical protein
MEAKIELNDIISSYINYLDLKPITKDSYKKTTNLFKLRLKIMHFDKLN